MIILYCPACGCNSEPMEETQEITVMPGLELTVTCEICGTRWLISLVFAEVVDDEATI